MAKKVLTRKTESSTIAIHRTPDQVGLERLIFFSDAVFAIAITLLSLEIRLPDIGTDLTDVQLFHSILNIWPKYLAYIISFLVIGVIWMGHHRKFRLIQSYDGTLIFINLLLLMIIAFIPFPTSLLSTNGNVTATVFYACVMILASLLSAAIWWYASYKDRLIDPHLDARQRRRENVAPLLTIVIFLLSIGLAFVNTGVARLSWILLGVSLRLTRNR